MTSLRATTPGSAAPAASVLDTVRAYVALTKPRIIELLLTTTLPTMILAAHGWPGLGLVIATLGGGSLAAGGANVLNCVADRDIDAVMNRTKRRPLVTGRASPRAALVFGLALCAAATAVLWVFTNMLAAMLTLGAILIYVVGYTLLLKRRTPQNIVWGGIAGCMPVLIGWSAVTGSLAWPPLLLFGIVFFWTPPHYWPLSLRFKDDYARAEVPMLPVVADVDRVARQVLAYTLAMIACSLLLMPVAHMTWIYGGIALAAGIWFCASCVRLYARARAKMAGKQVRKLGDMRVFHDSIIYLSIVFIAVAVDPFWPV